MSEVGSGMNIGSDYSGTEKTEKTDKATLRHHILSRRKRVPAEERGAAGELLVRRFPAHMIQDGPTVAAYVSMGSEIETRPLLRWLRLMAATCWCQGWGLGWKLAGVCWIHWNHCARWMQWVARTMPVAAALPAPSITDPMSQLAQFYRPKRWRRPIWSSLRLWQWTRRAIVWGVEPAGMTGPWLAASPHVPDCGVLAVGGVGH